MNYTFGGHLAFYRKQIRMTQKALAAAAGTTQQYISRLEKDLCEPTLSMILKLMDALQTPFEDLTFGIAPKL